MSIEKAKEFILRLRKEDELRKKFETSWQGRKKWDHDFITNDPPVIPKMMSELAPDQKVDPEGYTRFWRLRFVQEEIHYLLFYKGDYGPHKQNYLDGDSRITLESIDRRISDKSYEENLAFMSELISQIDDCKIGFVDFKAVWKDYVCWTYNVFPEYEKNDEVERFWESAQSEPEFTKILMNLEVSRAWSYNMAFMVSFYLQYGFSEDFKIIKKFVDALNIIKNSAAKEGFHFTTKEYLSSCIFRAERKPVKRERDEKYWEEDDPNRWHPEPKFVYISCKDDN